MCNFLNLLKKQIDGKSNVFKNDFSNIYYIVPNQKRATQLEYELFNQMRNGREESIIPPRILNYRYAFLEIACMLKYGKTFDKEKMTLFSQEWISFLMLKVSREIINNNQRHSSEERMATLLASSLEKLLRYKALNIKFDEDFENIQDSQSLTQDLINAYRKYPEVIKNYKNDEIFLTPLEAYEWLYNMIKNNEGEIKQKFSELKITVFIENLDDMELLFNGIANNLGFNKIENDIKEKLFLKYNEDGNKTKNIYAFNALYDEAESIAASVYKDITENNFLNHRIVIVPFNSNLKKALSFTFYRWNMTLKSDIYLSETDEYKLFYLCYALKTDFYSGDIERLLDIFKINCSSLKMPVNYFNQLKDEFYKLGFKSRKISEFKDLLKNFFEMEKGFDKISKIYKELYGESGIKRKKEILEFLLKKESFDLIDIIEKIFLENKQRIDLNVLELIYDISEEIIKIEEKSQLNDSDKMLLIELAGRRKVLYKMESIKEEISSVENSFKYANFFIPIIEPEHINNFNFDKIYLCGLDSSFDKIQPHELPPSIEEKLNVISPQEKKKKIFNDVLNVINKNCDLWVSYSYYSQSSRDVSGVSSLYMVLKEKLNIDDLNDGYLWKYTDMITKKGLPKHFSYSYKEANDKANDQNTKNNQNGVKRKIYTLYDLIFLAFDKENDIPKLPIKKLADFSLCPRKFVYTLFAKIASIKEIDFDGRINIAKGEFWHNVFKIAFEKYKDEFNSKDINQIIESLTKAKEDFKKQIEKFSESSDIFEMDFQMKVSLFAQKEKERKNSGYITEFVEKNLNDIIAENVLIDISDNKKIILTGRIDRVDKDKDNNLVFFDYKKSFDNANLFSTSRDRTKIFFRDAESAQVVLYSYFYGIKKQHNVIPAIISYENGDNTNLSKINDNQKKFISGFIDKFKNLCSSQVSEAMKENIKKKRFYCSELVCQNNEHNYCPYKEICFMENSNISSYIDGFFSCIESQVQDNRG